MFDIKKRKIIPDILNEIRSRKGRVNLKDFVIASYRFDRTVDDKILNNSTHLSGTSDLYFFDSKKSRRKISLNSDSPFIETNNEKNFFLYQPEGYSSKILSRYKGRSLYNNHLKGAEANIEVLSGSTISGGELSGSYLEVTGYNPAGDDKTLKYFFLEDRSSSENFSKPKTSLIINKNLDDPIGTSHLTYLSASAYPRLGFILSFASGSQATNGTRYKNFYVNPHPTGGITTSTARGTGFLGHHTSEKSDGYTIEIPHKSTDSGRDLVDRLTTAINATWGGHISNLSSSWREYSNSYEIEVYMKPESFSANGTSLKGQWDNQSKLHNLHKGIFIMSGSTAPRQLAAGSILSRNGTGDVVISWLTGTDVYDLTRTTKNLSISYGDKSVDFFIGNNTTNGTSNASYPYPDMYWNSGKPQIALYSPTVFGPHSTAAAYTFDWAFNEYAFNPARTYNADTGGMISGINALNLSASRGPGGTSIILHKKYSKAKADLTVSSNLDQDWQNKTLILRDKSEQDVSFIFSKLTSSIEVVDPRKYRVGIKNDNNSNTLIASKLTEAINKAYSESVLNISGSLGTGGNANKIQVVQKSTGERGNTTITGSIFHPTQMIITGSNFLSGSGDYPIIVRGADIALDKVSVSGNSFDFEWLDNNLPVNGDEILSGHYDGFNNISATDSKVGGICVQYNPATQNLYDILNNLKDAINKNSTSGFITATISDNENHGYKALDENAVINRAKPILIMSQSNPGIASNTAASLRGVNQFGTADLSQIIPNLSFTSFSGGVSKIGAASLDDRGLSGLTKKSYIFRLKTGTSSNNIIFSISSDSQTRCFLSSTSGQTEDLFFRINSTESGKYWSVRIQNSDKIIHRPQWLTVVISIDENNPGSGIADNYMAVFDSENNGSLLYKKGFTTSTSATGTALRFSSPKNARLFLGFGDSSTAIPDDYLNKSVTSLNLADFYHDFKIAELSILRTAIHIETAKKIAEAHLTPRAKSGFRNELPKKQLDKKFLDLRYRDKNKPFVESDASSPISVIRDVVYPNMLPNPEVGKAVIQFTDLPADDDILALKLPDNSSFAVKFNNSTFDLTGVVTGSLTNYALTGSTYPASVKVSPGLVKPDYIYAWYALNVSGSISDAPDTNAYKLDLSNNSRILSPRSPEPEWQSAKSNSLAPHGTFNFLSGALDYLDSATASNHSFLNNQAFTVSTNLWFNTTMGQVYNIGDSFYPILKGANQTLGQYEYYLNLNPKETKIKVGLYDASAQTLLVAEAPVTWSNNLSQIVFTYNGSNATFTRLLSQVLPPYGYSSQTNVIKIYYNGEELNVTEYPEKTGPSTGWGLTVPWNSINTQKDPLKIGWQEAGYAFGGAIGDVAIWDTSLTTAEVKSSYDAQSSYSSWYKGDLTFDSPYISYVSGAIDYNLADREKLQASISLGANSVSNLSGKVLGLDAPALFLSDYDTHLGESVIPVTSLETISGKNLYSYDFAENLRTRISIGNNWHNLITHDSSGTGKVSISAWIYPNSDESTSHKHIVSLGIQDIAFGLRANKLFFAREYAEDNGSGAVEIRWDTTTTVPSNVWSHVAVTFDDANATNANAAIRHPKFYLNGNLLASDQTGAFGSKTPSDIGSSGTSTIGNVHGTGISTDVQFAGKLAEVNIWNVILSHTKVINTFNAITESAALVSEEELTNNFVNFVNNTNRYSDSKIIATKNSARSVELKFDVPGYWSSGFGIGEASPTHIVTNSSAISVQSTDFLNKFEGFKNTDLGNSRPSDSIVTGDLSFSLKATIDCDIADLDSVYENGNITSALVDLVRNRQRFPNADIDSLERPRDGDAFGGNDVNEIPWQIASIIPPRYPAVEFDLLGQKYSARLYKKGPGDRLTRNAASSNRYNICLDDVITSEQLANALKVSIEDFIRQTNIGINVSIDGSKVILTILDKTIKTANFLFKGWCTTRVTASAETLFTTNGFNLALNPDFIADNVNNYYNVESTKIEPFSDSKDTTGTFFRKVTSADINLSDDLELRDHKIIEIPINPSGHCALGYTTGSDGFAQGSLNPVGYFNFSNQKWESINPTFVNNPIETNKNTAGAIGYMKILSTVDKDSLDGKSFTLTNTTGLSITFTIDEDLVATLGGSSPNWNLGLNGQTSPQIIMERIRNGINAANNLDITAAEDLTIGTNNFQDQLIKLTQDIAGPEGNTTITSNLPDVTVTNFANGLNYPLALSGSIQDYVTTLPFAFGPGQGFTIQGNLSSSIDSQLSNAFGHAGVGDLYDIEFKSYARPMSTFGFPFDKKFRPADGQKLNLSDYLEEDFILTGFQVVVSSSIQDSVIDGLGYNLSNDPSDYVYDTNYYNPNPKLINENPAHRRHGLTHPVSGFVSGSGTLPRDDLALETTGSMVGFGLGDPGAGKWSVIRDGSKFDKTYPWWRCDTFFLLREKPAINESINSNVWLGQDNLKIKASHSKRSIVNPYDYSKDSGLSSLELVGGGTGVETIDYPSNFVINDGKTQELIAYSQVSYYGYASREFLSGTTDNGSSQGYYWPLENEHGFYLDQSKSEFDKISFLSFVGLTAEEMAESKDYITFARAPGASEHNLKGFTADQQKYGSFHLTGSGLSYSPQMSETAVSRTWLDAGLGRDLNIMIGRDFGTRWLELDQNAGVSNSGRASYYKAIEKEKLKFSTILYQNNGNPDVGFAPAPFFAGFETQTPNAHRKFYKGSAENGEFLETSGDYKFYRSTSDNDLVKSQDLHHGVLDVKALVRDTRLYNLHHNSSIMHVDSKLINHARSNNSLALLSGSLHSGSIKLSSNASYKYDNLPIHVLEAQDPNPLEDGSNDYFGFTSPSLPFLRNLKVPSFWSGGDDYDTLGASRRIRSSLGNEIFTVKPFFVDAIPSAVNTGVKYSKPSLTNPIADTEIGKSMLSQREVTFNKGYEVESPYILKKNDNIILGFQVGLPGFSSAVNQYANIGGGDVPHDLQSGQSVQTMLSKVDAANNRSPQIPLDAFYPRCHQANFWPYAGSKLVLYGKYVKNNRTFTKPKKKDLGANIRYEVFGDQTITDRFDTELNSELSGSMFSEIYGKNTVGPELTPSTISVTMSNSRTNDLGGNPSKLFATGSITRFMSISSGQKFTRADGSTLSYDEVYFDSLPIDLDDYIPGSMLLQSGSAVDVATSTGYGPGSMGPDGDTTDYPDDFVPADLIGRLPGESRIPDYFVGMGAFNPETANVYHDGGSPGTLSSDVVDNYVGLIRESFLKVYNESFVKGFLFHSSSLKDDHKLANGTYAFDPQDRRQTVKDHRFGLRLQTNDSATFGILLNPDSHKSIAFGNAVYDYTKRYDEQTVTERQFRTTTQGNGQLTNDLDITRGFYGNPNGTPINSVLGVATIAGGQIVSGSFTTTTRAIYLSKHSRLTPARMLNAVNQVDDTEYRRNAAFVFGFGTRSDRGHRYLYGNGFVPWPSNWNPDAFRGLPAASTSSYWKTGASGNDYKLSQDYFYHQFDTRITVEHPAGVKYGMMNYDHLRPSAKFSRNHYGHFRDLLEGRKFGALIVSEASPDISNYELPLQGMISPDHNFVSPIDVTFVDRLQRPLRSGRTAKDFLFSQNLDKFQRSNLPYFDNNNGPFDDGNPNGGGGRIRKENEIVGEDVLIDMEIPEDLLADLG